MMKEMRRPLVLGICASFAVATVAAAQRDVAVPKSPPADYPVTITGCIHGTRLIPQSATSATASAAVNASEYLLDGRTDVLQIIRKDHDGHLDEITGIARVPATPAADRAGVATKPIGKKGRVVVGTRDASGSLRPAAHPVRLRVASVRHIANKCSTS